MTSENTSATVPAEGTRPTAPAAAAPTRRELANARRRTARRRTVAVGSIAAVALVATSGFALVNRAPSAEAVAAAHAAETERQEDAIASALADAQAKATMDAASQVVASSQGKVDASALQTSVASLADYESLDADTLADRVAATVDSARTVQSAAAEADRQADAAAAAAAAAAAQAEAEAQAAAAAKAAADAAAALAAQNTPAGAKATAQSLASSKYGWGSDQYGCLVNLWTKESGWNYQAYNPSGATGIPQALPGSKMATAGSDWATNASTQVAWGLDYIKRAYGTPCSAWGHSQSVNWY